MRNKKSDNDAIIGIAYDVGFNSKSTFNTAFKKFIKMTPSEYLSRNIFNNVNWFIFLKQLVYRYL